MGTISRMLVMVVMVGSGTLWAAGGVLPGGGTEGDPYLIEDLTDFAAFAGDPNYWDDYARLECDLNLAGITYTTAVIAPEREGTSYGFGSTPFTGVFDGNDHIISNLTIDDVGAGSDYLGLFGRIADANAEIKDLGLEDVNITGGYYSHHLGGLCGKNEYGSIINCYVTGSVAGGKSSYNIGGLSGGNYYGAIHNCYATGSVTGGKYSDSLGGLSGGNYHGAMHNCYATGSVTGGNESYNLGGLCGGTSTSASIINCYATGSVTGGGSLGGLCGYNSGSISNCYATGSVTGEGSLGGLCGDHEYGRISNCYATGLVTGSDDSSSLGGLCGWGRIDSFRNCYFLATAGVDNGLGEPLDDLDMMMQSRISACTSTLFPTTRRTHTK